MELIIDRDATLVERARVFQQPALVFPLETTVAALTAGGECYRLDRASFALVPPRMPHSLALPPAGATIVVTVVVGDEVVATAAKDYAPYVEVSRFSEAFIDATRAAPSGIAAERITDAVPHADGSCE